jgi:hypothetical protein
MCAQTPLATSDCILAQTRHAEYAYAEHWYTTRVVDRISGPDFAKSRPSFDGLGTILVRKISTIVNLVD